ncbi:LANO_0E14378g1_1 [Lachancea nothofagi CBS 11611]|uniref:Ribosome maturation protein SDO1 n=1 Tax=Lachancea nothofagi CBS 11611 TaxID=1266666 RepID=A0A1G4JZY6_9SACH|nr:LANO_0E14378g1_1 [Lachancea nothofagi CBS 11611]
MINQPSGQIKLTNVSIVKLKKGKKKFEIACYQNKVQDFRKGIEKDLDEVLQIHQVFINVSKGQVASKDDLAKSFDSDDLDTIIKEILTRGEMPLSDKERQLMTNKVNNEMLTIISAKCINPKSKKRYPPSMIHKALIELKFSVVINKPAKLQALEAIKALVASQIIPIARARMRVKVDLNKSGNSEVIEKLSMLMKAPVVEETDSTWSCSALIDPVAYRTIVELCNNKGVLQVLDMAVVESK